MDIRVYNGRWRVRNRDYLREYRRRWREKNRERLRKYRAKYRAKPENAEKHREHTRRWRNKKAKLGVSKLGPLGKCGPPAKRFKPLKYVRGPYGPRSEG